MLDHADMKEERKARRAFRVCSEAVGLRLGWKECEGHWIERVKWSLGGEQEFASCQDVEKSGTLGLGCEGSIRSF